MTKPNIRTDEEIKIRSVMMRLYHSRQIGEPFYHANLVNGEAPKLEAEGLIERCGDGWRLTDVGMQRWAEMNAASFNSKYHYQGPFYREMRDKLAEREPDMEVKLCKIEGCQNTRMINSKGAQLTLCEDHQRELWRKDAQRKRNSQANNEVKSVGQFTDGEPTPVPVASTQPAIENITVTRDPVDQPQSDDQKRKVEEFYRQEPITETVQQESSHDCETCESKVLIEALRTKSPKLAKLIDALQAEYQAAAELGL